MKTKELVSAI